MKHILTTNDIILMYNTYLKERELAILKYPLTERGYSRSERIDLVNQEYTPIYNKYKKIIELYNELIDTGELDIQDDTQDIVHDYEW